jgi:antitoxin MazE
MLTKIGNSQGVRIPKPLIKQAKLENCVIEFELTKDGLLLKPVKNNPREGWEEKFKNSSNELLIDDSLDNEAWDEI